MVVTLGRHELVVLDDDQKLGEAVALDVAKARISFPQVSFALRQQLGAHLVEAVVEQEPAAAVVHLTNIGPERLDKGRLIRLLGEVELVEEVLKEDFDPGKSEEVV